MWELCGPASFTKLAKGDHRNQSLVCSDYTFEHTRCCVFPKVTFQLAKYQTWFRKENESGFGVAVSLRAIATPRSDTVVTLESVLFLGGLASSARAVVDTEAGSWAALEQEICMLEWQFLTTCMPPCFPGICPLEESMSMSISLKRRHLMVYHRLQQHPYLHCRRLWQWALRSSHSRELIGVRVFPLLMTL